MTGLRTRGKELPSGTKTEYRQVDFKPYRVVDEILRDQVVIHWIADGRRNLHSLRRLTAQNL
jgi:hypothetical protein